MAAPLRSFVKCRFTATVDRAWAINCLGLTYCQRWARHFGQPAAQTHPHLLKQGEVTPGITKEEYQSRRTKILNSAVNAFRGVDSVKGHIVIIPSAAKTYMTHDIPYPFRQNTDFFYLSGFQEPDSVLLLHTTADGNQSVLFVPRRDPDKELWDGPRSGDIGALELTGVSEAKNIEHLENYLANYCKEYSQYIIWYDFYKPVHSEFHNKIFCEFLNQDSKRALQGSSQLLHTQRLIKSAAEVHLMKTSVDIASEAFIEVMKFSYPGVNESHLYAKMDFECRVRDAQILAYPPVVAGGNRANTIHYINNNQLIYDGEMVLMDAGCEYHGYTSDITRTWPVSGRFTEAQRSVYMALLHVQEKCISLCTPEHSMADIYKEMLELLKEQLIHLGILKQINDNHLLTQKVKEFCPHHVSHYLGMDVHDTNTISRSNKLLPGNIITCEPGLYIAQNRKDVPEKFRGIGIRIEDDILITESQPVVLSAACPKHPDHIEQIMSQR